MKLDRYNEYENIYGCDAFVKEKEKLYSKNRKNGEAYDRWLDRQLTFLDTTGLDVLIHHKQAFEDLTSSNGLYSITRREFAGNPRILFFTIVEEGEQDAFVLLTAFSELSDGSYRRAIEVAQKRRKEILELIKEDDADELAEET